VQKKKKNGIPGAMVPKSYQALWFYGWVFSCVCLSFFIITTCQVAVVDTIMCWLIYTWELL